MTAGSTTGYDHHGAHFLALLTPVAGPGEAGRIRRRLGEREPRHLTWVPLSAEARASAAQDPDPLVRRALVRAKDVTSDDLALLLLRPDPVVDLHVYEHRWARSWMRRLVLTPGRHADPAALAPLRERILATQRELPGVPHFVGAGVVSDAPEVVEHALRVRGTDLTSAEQLRAVQGLLSRPGRLRALLEAADAPLHPAVAELARAALDSGGDRLRAAVVTAEGPQGLVAGLRAGEAEPHWRRTLEWDALVAAHREEPLPEAAVRFLAGHSDCPESALAELYRTHPAVVADVARACPALVRAAAAAPGHPELARICAALSGQDTGPSAVPSPAVLAELSAVVLDAVAPARTAAAALTELGATPPLRDLLHLRLGADPDRWATLRTTLSRYKGTLAALLDAVAEGTAPAGSAKPPALTKPYRFLLYAAGPADLSALLPRLPDDLLTALLGKGSLPPHALDSALAAGDPRVAAAIGGNVALGAGALRRLTELDEPSVNAAVFLNQKATLSLRRAIASGLPRAPGRSERVPLDEKLRTALLGDTLQHLRTPLVTSGDAELVHHAWPFLSDRARHYAVVRVQEDGGATEVRRLLGLFGEEALTHPVLRTARDTDEPGGLKEDLYPFDDPDTLPALLAEPRGRNATRRLMPVLVHEPYAYDFGRLVAAHRATPFQPEPVEELLRHEDVDDVVRTAFTEDADDGQDTDPAGRLRSAPFPGWAWFARMAGRGLLAPERLVDTARPARAVLTGLRRPDDAVAAAARTSAAGLVREHLAGHPEGWVVALHLLPTYEGTLAELIQVAAQVAGPRPDAEELARRDARELAAVRETSVSVAAVPALTPVQERSLREEAGPLSALPAVHLLRALVPGAPVPTDRQVLRTLANAYPCSVPGVERPDWLVEACAAHGSAAGGEPMVPREAPLRPLSDMDEYRHGFVTPREMVARTPVRAMDPVPKAWRTHGAEGPQLRAARALVAERLGVDGGRWLRALGALEADGADLTFGEALDAGAADRPLGEALDSGGTGDTGGTGGTGGTGAEATSVTPSGARLLLHADVDALTAVLPLLGPGAAAALTGHACASGHLPEALVACLFARDDRQALLVVARSWRELYRDHALQLRLLGLDEPEVNAALYGRAPGGAASMDVHRTILSRRPQGRAARGPDDLLPLAPELRRELLGSSYYSAQREHLQRIQLEAADAEIVEHALASWGRRRPQLDHLLAARASLRSGGPEHLRSLVDRGLLSSAAAKLAVKALGSADPDAVLTARLDRELGADRLVARLRSCKAYNEELRVLELPYVRDWGLLRRAHEEQPFPSAVWRALGELPDAPDAVTATGMDWQRLRRRALVGRSVECARAAVAHRERTGHRDVRTAMFDHLVERGLLTGADLVHRAAGAAGVLHYLAEGAVRRELPDPVRTAVREATDEIARLATKLLSTDESSWKRLFAALTGQDVNWLRPGCATTVVALLEHSARTPV
ncbi:hypothetical protein ABZ446_23800 [Streptomyces sp. NPDC005813]|uniref:hypothetical protein n=1 Tax=Streptomyces sp. NPDC005813 TaxID=3155592 RepID=UPI0034011CCD